MSSPEVFKKKSNDSNSLNEYEVSRTSNNKSKQEVPPRYRNKEQDFEPEIKNIEKVESEVILHQATEHVLKKHRKTYSVNDKKRLIEIMESGEDYYKFGQQMGFGRKSIRNIVSRWEKFGVLSAGKRGRTHRSCRITDEIGTILLDFVDNNYYANMEKMKEFLATIDCNVSTKTISRFLKDKVISFRKIRRCVEDRNSESILQSRSTYVRRLLEEGWTDEKCIYIDECAFNTWTSKVFDINKRGDAIPTRKCINISVAFAISINGPVHYKIICGSFKTESYQGFINELTEKLFGTHYYLIHYDTNNHGSVTSNYNFIKYLPPHSQFLNPIESVFTRLKAAIRNKVMTTQEWNTNDSRIRVESMKVIVEEELKKDVYFNLRNNYNHIKRFFPKSLFKEEILTDM